MAWSPPLKTTKQQNTSSLSRNKIRTVESLGASFLRYSWTERRRNKDKRNFHKYQTEQTYCYSKSIKSKRAVFRQAGRQTGRRKDRAQLLRLLLLVGSDRSRSTNNEAVLMIVTTGSHVSSDWGLSVKQSLARNEFSRLVCTRRHDKHLSATRHCSLLFERYWLIDKDYYDRWHLLNTNRGWNIFHHLSQKCSAIKNDEGIKMKKRENWKKDWKVEK